MTEGQSGATSVPGSVHQPGRSVRLPTPLHMLMLAALVALGAAFLAVPYLGLASLALAFVVICVVMLLVILGWAAGGPSSGNSGSRAPSGRDADSKRPLL